jgi:hypothetical protein
MENISTLLVAGLAYDIGDAENGSSNGKTLDGLVYGV